jgi:xanthine dehydrogenase YagT iron-sulfur-binding subunit
MQQAFIDHDAFQCGYCTSGQIMAAIACQVGHAKTAAQIREYMSGNSAGIRVRELPIRLEKLLVA